jgi:AraC-like DNA-binding protein
MDMMKMSISLSGVKRLAKWQGAILMKTYTIYIAKPLQLIMTGKFVAPSRDWKHMSRMLMDYELFVPIKGTLYIANDQEKYELREGDYLLMPPRTKQFGYLESDCSFYWLHFLAEGQLELSSKVEPSDCPPEHIIIPGSGKLSNKDKLIVMMKQLQDSIRSYQDQTLNNYLATSIMCELYNQTFRHKRMSQPQLKKQQLYNDIVDYIRWNRFEQLQVSHIADHFGYNAKYISQMFAKISGISLKRFILQQKMDEASFLLTDTNMTITEIALQLGYYDSHHFMKSFKQITNLTPSSYRNAASNRLLNH